MRTVTGKYGTAKVFTDLVEDTALEQVQRLMEMPYAENANVRLMPDIHAGAGCTIGTTMRITDKVCPNLVGVDIGCGMKVYKVSKHVTPELMQQAIEERIPSGRNVREDCTVFDKYAPHDLLDNLVCKIDTDRAMRSMGTLGGGNHFIELDRDSNGDSYIVIHSGSRHLGVEIAKYYQDLAIKRKNITDDERRDVINRCKAEGHPQTIKDELEALKGTHFIDIPNELMYLDGQDMQDYLHDMRIAQKYAMHNRTAMLGEIWAGTGESERMESRIVNMGLSFETVHNYIDFNNMVLRKGAVSALKNEVLIIPMNMRDGSLICFGKGNPDWNGSAPHGAGRLMSRAQAKRTFTLDEFRDSMQDVVSWSVTDDTLDECPMAYKPMQSILDNIKDTVSVCDVIKPIYNFKASE